ncbi:hypothetical protein GH714_016926 [Hevea brasiliensis]|uniref:PPM-type phosphatase domain-containing protein n=1 Tax=Hevea brasiliensis TaxID=3981 RepID=A0A6A6ME56_HEVBR|nr:hypothetical protein GH714_016926 [Hevea brasiliensis]
MSSSTFSNNSIAITVSDEESDELSRMRARVRRKSKKQRGHRVKNKLSQRVPRFLLKYWMVLIFLPAAGLLVFEASSIGKKPSLDLGLERDGSYTSDLKVNQTIGESNKNLDRLDPPRCLKLLPPEELQRLEIPMHDESSPVKNVNETAEIHCGFYSENGGFKISDEDKLYMQTCEVVVSTCAFGGGDDLYQPIGVLDTSLQKVCFLAFWDEITLAAQESKGRTIGEDHFIGNGGLWLQGIFLSWTKDSKSQFRRDPVGVLEALLWRSNSVLAISQHGARSNVYEEATAVVNKHKATPEDVEVQLTRYRQDGLPEDKRFNGKKVPVHHVDDDLFTRKEETRDDSYSTEDENDEQAAASSRNISHGYHKNPKRAIKKAYKVTDNEILDNIVGSPGGSMAVTAILIDQRRLIVANVGDSQAVLCRNGVAKPLSVDHEPEKARELVESKGGFVSKMPGNVPRVDGQLATTRAFGDGKLKEHITSEPDLTTHAQSEFWKNPKRAIKKAYKVTDDEILDNIVGSRGGSMAVTAILIDQRRLIVANVGDSWQSCVETV